MRKSRQLTLLVPEWECQKPGPLRLDTVFGLIAIENGDSDIGREIGQALDIPIAAGCRNAT
ncbi:hypothetical protein CD928_14255 [Sphingopyxis sp. GW247-27LB]|nr:hypothetical protein CD928_14255 [Sphingopyxis sp. GW247-27LB]